jgi:hypothetical protein
LGLAVVAAAVLVADADVGRASRLGASGCKRDYDYTGVQNETVASGIRALISTVIAPDVRAGHVGGWVGVGGQGLGPGKTDEWLQVGYSGFPDGETQIYYEVALPNKPPTYHTVVESLPLSAKNRLGVLEVARPQGSWRVLLNGKAVSPVIALPQSHDRFAPLAIGETWNAGTTKCNVWGYGFGHVQVAAAPGGSWKAGKAGYQWNSTQHRSVKTAPSSFTARSTASAATTEADRQPPLLGHGYLASKLLRRKLATQCVAQREPARFQSDTLYLSQTTCEVLIGYAIAQPHAPQPGTGAGRKVAATAFSVLRVIVRAARAAPANVDCRAAGLFYGAFRGLGATSGEAVALRKGVLKAGSGVSPPVSLRPGCPIR